MTLIFSLSGSEDRPGVSVHDEAFDFEGMLRRATATTRGDSFNDFNCYDSLRNVEGCIRVRISSIRAQSNASSHAFQVGYKSIFQDGSTSFTWAKPHFFSRGYYSFRRGIPREERSWDLQDDEYVSGLLIQQGDIVDGITFVTNHRKLHSRRLDAEGSHVNMMLSQEHEHRIVAFAGTSFGVLERIGYYAEPTLWSFVRHFVMLRWLMMEGRATVANGKEENIVSKFTNIASEELFINILEYLVDKKLFF